LRYARKVRQTESVEAVSDPKPAALLGIGGGAEAVGMRLSVLLDRSDMPMPGLRASFLSEAFGLGGEGERCLLVLLRDVSRNVDRNAGSSRGV
jgi:hypothetical protein